MILSPEKFIEKIKTHFDKTDKHIFITTLLVGLITNFYFFISRGVAPDTLTNIPEHFSDAWEISLGRFFLQFFDNARFGFVNQLLIVFLSLIFIAAFLIVVRKIFKIKSKIILFLLTFIFATAPQFTETYEFLYCADAYTFALLFSAVAVYATTKIDKLKSSKKYLLLAIVSTIIVCAIYQAYLGVLLGLLVIYAIKLTLEKSPKSVLKYFIKSAILIFLGICAYYVLFRIICKLTGIRPSGYKGADSLGIGTIKALPESIKSAFEDFYLFFFKDGNIINNSYYGRFIIYGILFTTFIIATLSNLREKRGYISKSILLILLLAVFPIAVNIMNLVAPGTRTFLVTGPGLLTTFILFAIMIDNLTENSFNNLIKYISYITLFILGWTFILANIRTYIVRENQVVEFEQILKNVYSEAVSLDDYQKDLPFLFSYNIQTPAKDIEKTNGAVTTCNISWEAYYGTTRYDYFYEQYLGVKDLKFADNETYEKIVNTNEFKNMPVYPEKGYAKIIDGIIVVKTSEETYLNEKGEFISW